MKRDPSQDVAMGGKAKPTKHTAKELAQKERAERAERVRMSASKRLKWMSEPDLRSW